MYLQKCPDRGSKVKLCQCPLFSYVENPSIELQSLISNRQIKEAYRLDESECQTCMAVTFCCPCAQAQDYMEARDRNDIL